jgi:DNA-binding XRE family transcriptional regulator
MREATPEMVERVRVLYTAICCGMAVSDGQTPVDVIRELERTVGRSFRTTAEFHDEVSAFLGHKGRIGEMVGVRLKRARRKAKLTQGALARLLGVTCRAVTRWESNEMAPLPRALEWLNGQNGHQGEM